MRTMFAAPIPIPSMRVRSTPANRHSVVRMGCSPCAVVFLLAGSGVNGHRFVPTIRRVQGFHRFEQARLIGRRQRLDGVVQAHA